MMQWSPAGLLLIAALGASQSRDKPPAFEVASVKPANSCDGRGGPRFGISASPGRLRITCQTADFLIRQAYIANGRDPLFVDSLLYNQTLKGIPSWGASLRFDIEATAARTSTRETMMGPMLSALLEERFQLKVHRERREVPAFVLTVAKGGARLQPAKEDTCNQFDADNPEPAQGRHICGILVRSLKPGSPLASFYGATVADLCRELSRLLRRTVTDGTNLTGLFDIALDVSRADLFPNAAILARQAEGDGEGPPIATDPQGSSISAALQKLGLKLELSKAVAEFLIIDKIEKPSGN